MSRLKVVRWVGALCLGGALAILARGTARGEDALPPLPEPQASAGPSEAESQAHWAKGEVRYADRWVPVSQMYNNYLNVQKQLEPLLEEGKAARQKDYEIGRQISAVRSDQKIKRAPLYRQRSEDQARRAQLEKILSAQPPPPPRYQPEPTPPSSSSYGGSSGYSGGYGGNTGYQNAQQRYQQELNRVRAANNRLKQEYQKQVNDLNAAQAKAKTDLADLDKQLADITKQVNAIDKEADDKVAPLIEQRKAASDEMNGLRLKAAALINQRTLIEKSLDSAPPEVLWRCGIARWEDAFYKVPDLEKKYADTEVEIAKAHEDMKAAAEKAGREFPQDWRHPWQDRQDNLKALLDRIHASLAGKG